MNYFRYPAFVMTTLAWLGLVLGQSCSKTGQTCCGPISSVYCRLVEAVRCCNGSFCQLDEGETHAAHCVVGTDPKKTWGASKILAVVSTSVVVAFFSVVVFCVARELGLCGRSRRTNRKATNKVNTSSKISKKGLARTRSSKETVVI